MAIDGVGFGDAVSVSVIRANGTVENAASAINPAVSSGISWQIIGLFVLFIAIIVIFLFKWRKIGGSNR